MPDLAERQMRGEQRQQTELSGRETRHRRLGRRSESRSRSQRLHLVVQDPEVWASAEHVDDLASQEPCGRGVTDSELCGSELEPSLYRQIGQRTRELRPQTVRLRDLTFRVRCV